MTSVFKKLSSKKSKDSHKDKDHKDHKDKDHKDHKDKDHKDHKEKHKGNSPKDKDKGLELARAPDAKNDHTKKRSGQKDKKDEKHERKLNSVRGSKPKPVQPSSDPPQVNDETEDNLDDNQNLIQLTPQAGTPAPQQSTKVRKDSKKKVEKEHAAGLEVPGTQSATAKDSTAKKKKKKDKKEIPDNFVTLAKAIEGKTVEDMTNEFKVNHKPGCEELNRDTRYVLTFNVPPDSDFYDASRVEMPGIDCKFIAAAAPTNDNLSMETFWRLVYDANVANIFFLEPAGKDFSSLAHFLPLEPASSKDYGKMFINNKKVERNPKEYQAVVEVLPEGCSNSIIVRFIQGRQWPDHVARKYRRIALHMVRTLKNEKSTSLIVCKDGRGRSGQFILLHSIISEVVGSAPDYKLKMAESLGALRQMRWGAIQSEQQYLLMYMLSLDFLVCKSKNFENQARNLEKAILDYLKKQKDTAKALTPKESKDKIEKVDKIEKTDKTDNKKEEKTDNKKDEKDEKKKDNEKSKKEDKKDEEKKKEKEPDTVKQASEAATQFGHAKEPHEKESGPQIVQSLYL
ncbi:hypothetical protein PRIPAC_85894 [Pristionchus pacificus]|uniref:Tyrosine phosphatase n=1 Tax=Pristionchus pacificus TaxID=54126 RepID=A0A2A6BNR2_PRIPA|nr:hypothetical protein PRIPAC_85894 [Pristionchus pacificus]|eukprot:PDM67555.1 tyrosine phosphatase [Pristionchus pacificus]